MQLVGFAIEIYYDARPCEREKYGIRFCHPCVAFIINLDCFCCCFLVVVFGTDIKTKFHKATLHQSDPELLPSIFLSYLPQCMVAAPSRCS